MGWSGEQADLRFLFLGSAWPSSCLRGRSRTPRRGEMRVVSSRRWQFVGRRAGQVQMRACARSPRRAEGSAAPEGVSATAALSMRECRAAGSATAVLWSAPLSCGLPSCRIPASLPVSLGWFHLSRPVSCFILLFCWSTSFSSFLRSVVHGE